MGTRNLGCYLFLIVNERGEKIIGVWSRNLKNAKKEALRVNAIGTNKLAELPLASTIWLAVPDDYIEKTALAIKSPNSILTHFAGSTPLSVLSKHHINSGVVYPFQSFTKNNPVESWNKIPVFYEGKQKDLPALKKLALLLSPKVQYLNSEKRAFLHLSGIFGNNFSNFMFLLAYDLIKKAGLKSDLLHPLLEETVKKAITTGPEKGQTGPARRSDLKKIKELERLLARDPQLKKVFRVLSDSISRRFQ